MKLFISSLFSLLTDVLSYEMIGENKYCSKVNLYKMNTYKTRDIKIAAFLKTKGVKLLSILRESNKTVYFEFDDNHLCETLAVDYINGSEVSAKDLFETRDSLMMEVKR